MHYAKLKLGWGSTKRAIRVGMKLHGLKLHGPQIATQEPVMEWFAESCQYLNGFHRPESADGCGNGTEYGEFSIPVPDVFGVKASQARCALRLD